MKNDPTAGGVFVDLVCNLSHNYTMMNEKGNEMILTRKFLRSLNFRVFRDIDYHGFAGVESPVPLICDENEDFLVILDGNRCEFYSAQNMIDGYFDADFVCEDVTRLPY